MMSYGIASLAAMLAALCYSEFAAAIPISGSAYNYIGMTYGEFMGWCVLYNSCSQVLWRTSSNCALLDYYFAVGTFYVIYE